MAHALVHAADQHHQRRARGQRQIAIGRQPKAERDRHAGKDAAADHADKEDDQVEIAERLQPGLREPEQADHGDDREHGRQHGLEIAGAKQPERRKQRHQRDADGQGRRAPAVEDLQRGRGDVALLVGVFVGRPGDHHEERQRCRGRHQIEISAHRRPRAGDHGRHPHMLAAAERDGRAQHRQPQEQDGSEFIRPDQRPVKAVARHHAGKQDDDLGRDQQRRRYLDEQAKCPLDRVQQ